MILVGLDVVFVCDPMYERSRSLLSCCYYYQPWNLLYKNIISLKGGLHIYVWASTSILVNDQHIWRWWYGVSSTTSDISL